MRGPRIGYLSAGLLLLVALGLGLWRFQHPGAPSPLLSGAVEETVSGRPDSGKLRSRVHGTEVPDQTGKVPVERSRPESAEEKRDLEQINQWIADDSLSLQAAAGKLWAFAADPARTPGVREEALAHALNLTENDAYAGMVLPLLSQKGRFTDEMSEKILDDLYNRPAELKRGGTAAMLGVSSGELREHVRELLVFELGGEEAESLSDAELVRRAGAHK